MSRSRTHVHQLADFALSGPEVALQVEHRAEDPLGHQSLSGSGRDSRYKGAGTNKTCEHGKDESFRKSKFVHNINQQHAELYRCESLLPKPSGASRELCDSRRLTSTGRQRPTAKNSSESARNSLRDQNIPAVALSAIHSSKSTADQFWECESRYVYDKTVAESQVRTDSVTDD